MITYAGYILLLWAGMLVYGLSRAQSGGFGNTFIHSGGEMVIFGAHDFQNGGFGIMPGMLGTERQPGIGVLSFVDGASWLNAAGARHVDGYVRSYQSGPFIFPIGDDGKYYPAAVSAAALAEPATAAYYAVNPSLAITSNLMGGNYPVLPLTGPFPVTAMGPGVTRVDSTGYWDIDGTTPASITLTWDAAKNISGLVTSLGALRILGWDGTRWEVIPSAADAVSLFGSASTLTEGSITGTGTWVPGSYTVYTLGAVCMADTLPPVVSEDTLFVYCPDSVADLSVITGIGLPAGTVISFHTDSIASVGNEMDTLLVGPGIYYAASKDTANLCYSPGTPVYVLMGADTVAPVIAGCPPDITVSNDPGNCSAVVTWVPPVATDNCGGPVSVTSTHTPADTFAVGTTTVQYVFTDSAGNADTCSFNVTVTNYGAISLHCPADITVEHMINTCYRQVYFPTIVATTDCGNVPVSVTTDYPSGYVFPVGTTTVTVTASAGGNDTTCTFNVTVLDVQPPHINLCPIAITLPANAGQCSAVAAWIEPTVFENCAGVTLTSNFASGDTFPVGTTTVTYIATDAAGLTDTCSFTVTVTDTEAPVTTTCPTDITVSSDPGQCAAAVTWTVPTATDNCGGSVSVTSTHTPGDVFPVGTTTVTYTFTDSVGNSADCTFDVTVNDTEAPLIAGCPQDVVSCTGMATWTAPTATDNCSGTVTVIASHQPGSIFPAGVTTVTYTFTDAAGNTDTCTFTVTVSKPVLTPAVTAVSCFGANDGTAAVTVQNGVAPFTYSWTPAGSDSMLTNLGPGTYTVTVTDASGCRDSISMTVTEPAALVASVETLHEAQCGLSDGYIQVTVDGGTPDYVFAWSDGQTTQNLYNAPEGSYTLLTTDANGCTDTLEASMKCSFGKIPQLVTPNGDGHNDTWEIPGIEGYKEAVVEIYNRWGNLVYKSSPYLNNWAGYSENATDVGQAKLPAGTYFYVIVLTPGSTALTGYIELQY